MNLKKKTRSRIKICCRITPRWIGKKQRRSETSSASECFSLISPKSGRQNEVVFIPKKVAGRLREFIRSNNLAAEEQIFQMSYTGARHVVKKAGRLIGVEISPHDLRRHAATYASRAGAAIEIVSKVILRHANPSTTQRYLGKVSDDEASRWFDNIFS